MCLVKITRLRLRNFKSFRKADMPIAEGFTVIAGANATGKSNILDSLLFVLGITSLKMLRASKLTELINHDAEDGIAKVEVELKDKKRNYVISRTIDRQGKSVFRLDGKRRGLNEVTALLQELGIKATGHNIVAQGDITKVIEMNPKQRREVIDEVAGLSEFEDKKEEAMKKLEKVDRRIKDTFLVLNEREKRLDELEKEREAALRFNSLNEELKSSKATILSTEIRKIKAELSGSKRKLELMQKEIDRKEGEKKTLEGQEKGVEEKLENITRQMIEAGERTYSTIGREVEKKRADIRITEERINSIAESIEANFGKKTFLKEKKAALSKSIEEKGDLIEKKSAELKEVGFELDPFEKKRSEKAKVIDSLNKSISEQEKVIEDTLKELHEKRQQEHEIESLMREFKKEISFLSEEAKKISLDKEGTSIAKKQKVLKGFSQRIEQLQGSLNAINEEITSLKNEKKGLRSELERMQENLLSIMKLGNALAKEIDGLLKFFENLLEVREAESYLKKKEEREKELERISEGRKNIEESIKASENKRENLTKKLKELRQELNRLHGVEAAEKLEQLKERYYELKDSLTELQTELKELSKRRTEIDEEISAVLNAVEQAKNKKDEEEKKLAELKTELARKETELDKATEANKILEQEKETLQTKLRNLEEKVEEVERVIEQKERNINEFNLQCSKNEVRIVDLEQEFEEYEGIELLKGKNINELKKRIPEIEKEIASLGAINMKALESFENYRKEVVGVREKANKLEEERQAVLEMIDKIEVKKLNVFMQCFEHINKKFNELYYSFFEGEGQLGLSNPENPLDGGLLIEAKYKEDKLKSIDAMSGGEKSLTALAFLFAIQSFEPAPFYVFDEADAALDMANSLKIASMIKEISRDHQFISITHNDTIVKAADQLIGVALNKQKSSVIGLKLKDANNKGKTDEINSS